MGIRDERAAVFLFDKVNFVQGIFKQKVEVPPEEIPVQDVQKAYRIQYYPVVPARRAVSEYVLNHVPNFISDTLLVRTTDTMYPASAIEGPRTLPEFGADTPEWVVILHEDIYGNARFADEVEMSVEASITEATQERTQAKKESAVSRLQRIGGETVPERDGKSPKDNTTHGGGVQ